MKTIHFFSKIIFAIALVNVINIMDASPGSRFYIKSTTPNKLEIKFATPNAQAQSTTLFAYAPQRSSQQSNMTGGGAINTMYDIKNFSVKCADCYWTTGWMPISNIEELISRSKTLLSKPKLQGYDHDVYWEIYWDAAWKIKTTSVTRKS